MRTSAPDQLPLFRSDLQARLLSLLVTQPDRLWERSELQRLTGAAQTSVYEELRRLVDAGIVETEQRGRTVLYRASEASPLLEPLRQLVERSVGIEPELRRRLEALPGIEAAALFGSWARGELRPESDVDLLVVGRPDYRELAAAVAEVERLSGRAIDLVVATPREVAAARRGGDGVLGDALRRGSLVRLVGDLGDGDG